MRFAHHLTTRFILVFASTLVLLQGSGAVALAIQPPRSPLMGHVAQLFRMVEGRLDEPEDRAAMQQLLTHLTSGTCTLLSDTNHASPEWVELVMDHEGLLCGVTIDAPRLLSHPPLIQQAVVLHELTHLRWAKRTRQRIDQLLIQYEIQHQRYGTVSHPAVLNVFGQLLETLVEEEFRAYARDLRYVNEVVTASGGFEAYLETLPTIFHEPMRIFYSQHVTPFVLPDGMLRENALRAFIFQTFAHRYPRYSRAAVLLGLEKRYRAPSIGL